ncbi:MAG: hypothetical protein Q8O51_00400 [bacterium]|nr:hypothetical protein [bacterium]
MQFLDTISLAWRFRWLILGVILIPTILAVSFAATQPVSYSTSIAFTVNRINKQDVKEYQYDGYYALQASDLLSETVVSWFLTPSVIVEMYDAAAVPANVTDFSSLTARFKIKKYSSQNLGVTFTSSSPSDAQKLAAAVVKTVEVKASQLNQSADRKALFEVVGSKPVTVERSRQVPLVGSVGFVLGAFLAVLITGLLGALRGHKQPTPTQ